MIGLKTRDMHIEETIIKNVPFNKKNIAHLAIWNIYFI